MITTRLKGGLGNQMFQYAVARAVTQKNDQNLALDISWFKAQDKREFSLAGFNLKGEIVDLNLWQSLTYSSNFLKYITNDKKTYINEQKEFSFDPSIFSASGDTLMEGYWQHPLYFSSVEEIIREDFTLKRGFGKEAESIKRQIENSQSVSVHLRRGDYVEDDKINKIYKVCSQDYYSYAIKLIENDIESPHLFIFSDDINWVKENMNFKHQVTYVSQKGLSDIEELVLMSYCKHNIIANSTFSWWAAWLNENTSKLVITPLKWFNDSERSSQCLIPNSWKRI